MGTNAHEIDVVIPVFNGDAYIREAVQSALDQTVAPRRVFVVDDGSTDRTAEVVKLMAEEDARVILLRQNRQGVSAARNVGIRASSAPLISFLDSDDIWLPRKLELQIRALEVGGANVGFVHSSYFLIDSSGAPLDDRNVVPPRLRGRIFSPLLLENYVLSGSASSVMVRRDVLEQAGFFDERLFHGEDWDLWIRLAYVSDVDFTSEAVVGIRVHDQSAQRRHRTDREAAFFNQQLLVYNKWFSVVGQKSSFRKSLRKRACNLVLPLLWKPRSALAYYQNLATSDNLVARSIFRSTSHFWVLVAISVLRVVWWRMRCVVGLETKGQT